MRLIHRFAGLVTSGIVACVCVCGPMRGLAAAAEKVPGRWAVLIGVDDYTELKKLRFAGNDQRALAEQLIAAGFPKDQVFLMHDKATEKKYLPFRQNIDRQIDLVLGLAEQGDLVIVGFSGHGVQIDGKSYLCPEDTQLDKLAETTIAMEGVYDRVLRSRASLRLLLVDACRNDLLPAGRRGVAVARGIGEFAAAKEQPPAGILLLSSCAPGQASVEDEEFGHGVFMHFLIEGLKGKAANAGGVSLAGLYDFASLETKKHVARKFNDFQTPALKGEIAGPFEICSAIPLERRRPRNEREISNSIGMKLRLIPAGRFNMGEERPVAEEMEFFKKYGEPEELTFSAGHPQHEVRITKPFYLGVHEVTVGQFRQFVNEAAYQTDAERDGKGGWGYDGDGKLDFSQKPEFSWRYVGFPQGEDHPVVNVSWNDAVAFCAWLGKKEGGKYRLPTEAEWEYACRAGTTTRYYSGDDPETLAQVGNVADAAGKAKFSYWKGAIGAGDGYVFTSPVGRFRPNAFGLFDMHGNVNEWCADRGVRFYQDSPITDPTYSEGLRRGYRGGAWALYPANCRSATRSGSTPDRCNQLLGFRACREANEGE